MRPGPSRPPPLFSMYMTRFIRSAYIKTLWFRLLRANHLELGPRCEGSTRLATPGGRRNSGDIVSKIAVFVSIFTRPVHPDWRPARIVRHAVGRANGRPRPYNHGPGANGVA